MRYLSGVICGLCSCEWYCIVCLRVVWGLTSSLVDLSCRGGVVGWPAWLSRSGSTELVREPLPSFAPLPRPYTQHYIYILKTSHVNLSWHETSMLLYQQEPDCRSILWHSGYKDESNDNSSSVWNGWAYSKKYYSSFAQSGKIQKAVRRQYWSKL